MKTTYIESQKTLFHFERNTFKALTHVQITPAITHRSFGSSIHSIYQNLFSFGTQQKKQIDR